jgi:TPR repeat protein
MTACELRRGLFALLLMVLASAAFGAGARAQSYDDGMRAYDAGDFAKALEIWGPVAENGDAVAQYSLGKLLENGGAGVPRDLVAAAKWYQRSASQGISAAQNNLGLMYAQGRGVPQDVARAAKFWRDAAAKDHVIAQFNLGLAYFRGEGVAEDRGEALRWFRRAGELGLADAQYALGQIIRTGLAGEANEAEALHWYRLAVAQGHVKAETQAQQLRDAGVVARMPAAAPAARQAPAVAASEPPPPPKPVAKPVAPEPEPETVVIAAPEPEPETVVIAATEPEAAPPGGAYSAWLISFKDAAEARAYLEATQAKHPELFAAAPGAVSTARPGQGGTFHRVLAGGLPSRAAARDLCRRLRAAEPGAFCKVLEN